MNIIFVLLFFIFPIKCIVEWNNEIDGHDKNNSTKGYAGMIGYRISDFYLCSERKYRVHYEHYDINDWSEEFTACQPTGRGDFIDAISISGGIEYGGNVDYNWSKNITCYDIHNSNCYLGEIQEENDLYCIYIYGDEIYRTAYFEGVNSNEKNISNMAINNFFKVDSFYNYENETKMEIECNKFINVTVKLFNTSNLNLIHFTGSIVFKISNNKFKQNDNTDKLLSNYLKKLLNEIVGLDIDFIDKRINSFFLNIFSSAMHIGNVAINFYWLQNLIEIDVASKIETNYHSYRGGYRIKLYLNDKDLNLLVKVQKICKTMIKYTGIKISESLKKNLLYFNSFKIVDDVIKQLGAFSTLAEEILFYTIFAEISDATKAY